MTQPPEDHYRDRAILLACKVLRRLIERTWLPWGDIYEKITARVIDLVIAEAVEQAVARIREEFTQDIYTQELAALLDQPEPPQGRPTQHLPDTRPFSLEEQGAADFAAWKARREARRQ